MPTEIARDDWFRILVHKLLLPWPDPKTRRHLAAYQNYRRS